MFHAAADARASNLWLLLGVGLWSWMYVDAREGYSSGGIIETCAERGNAPPLLER